MTIKNRVEKMQTTAVEVMAINRLPSGNIRVFIKPKEAKETLQLNTEWNKTASHSAGIAQKIYAVLAHSIQVSNVNTSNQAAGLAKHGKTTPGTILA